MRPAAGTPGQAINRLLRPRTGSDGRNRGTPRYYASFERLPSWCEQLSRNGLVGVYENLEGRASRALVFFEDRAELLDSGGDTSVALEYRQIVRVLPFSKEPVARELSVEMQGGRVVVLPVEGPEGDVSLVARVLFNVRG